MNKECFEEDILQNKFRKRQEFENYLNNVYADRLAYEKELAQQCKSAPNEKITVSGFCENCGQMVDFELDMMYSDGKMPNYRERLVCPKCKLNNRQRAIVAAVLNDVKSTDSVYAYEQVTAVYDALSKKLTNLIGSEYVSSDAKSGDVINGILHEDAENLSFKDQSFDVILSCDVFEHVVDYRKCFEEAYRVLKPNGKIYMTLPFRMGMDKTIQRAKIQNGKLIHVEEPVYHGNPMSEEGSLVFWDYGWDLLDVFREIGFSDAYLSTYYSKEKGYLGGVPYCIVLEKYSTSNNKSNGIRRILDFFMERI